MSNEIKNNEKHSIFVENMATLMSPDGFQKYVLGTKKDGTPRAIYDILKDYNKPKKKKKKNGKKKKSSDIPTSYSFYLSTTSDKKKKKKNKKKNKDKNKHWHI